MQMRARLSVLGIVVLDRSLPYWRTSYLRVPEHYPVSWLSSSFEQCSCFGQNHAFRSYSGSLAVLSRYESIIRRQLLAFPARLASPIISPGLASNYSFAVTTNLISGVIVPPAQLPAIYQYFFLYANPIWWYIRG